MSKQGDRAYKSWQIRPVALTTKGVIMDREMQGSVQEFIWKLGEMPDFRGMIIRQDRNGEFSFQRSTGLDPGEALDFLERAIDVYRVQEGLH
jgi:hypothetical protein